MQPCLNAAHSLASLACMGLSLEWLRLWHTHCSVVRMPKSKARSGSIGLAVPGHRAAEPVERIGGARRFYRGLPPHMLIGSEPGVR